MKTLSALALAATLFTAVLPATAATQQGALTLATPLSAATLSSGPVDMSVYYTRAGNQALDVVATYITDAAPDQPRQLVLTLSDGDSVNFSLPGQPDTLYSFDRNGDAVTVKSQPIAQDRIGA